MTVLVDEARWRWRGRLWAHLVSDRSLEELHAFAEGIGLRRVAFQGDHYDVDVEHRERAVAEVVVLERTGEQAVLVRLAGPIDLPVPTGVRVTRDGPDTVLELHTAHSPAALGVA